MKKIIAALLTTWLVLTLVVAACAPGATSEKGPITVGSKIDTEGALLSQMIILMLRDNGFEVIDKSSFGPTPLVREAITSGELDIYPEYTGNGAFFFGEADSVIWKDALLGYERVKELDMEQNNIVWLTPAPANNTWAIAIPETLSKSEGIESLDDFATYVNGGGYVKLIGSEEFVTSEAALPAFQEAYGFTLSQDQLLAVASGDTAQTEKAASEGTDGINAAMAYGTDGSISAFGLVVLSDPRGVQPVYEPTPIIRSEVHEQYPEIATILAPVFKSLNLVKLQTMNGKIAVEGQNAAEVARGYLEENNFLK